MSIEWKGINTHKITNKLFFPMAVFLSATWLFFGDVTWDKDLLSKSFPVVLNPKHSAMISGEVITTVTRISKHMGESFEAGEVLLELKSHVYEKEYEKAKALVGKTKAIVDARSALYEDGLVSTVDLKEAESLFAEAEAALALAKRNFEGCFIKAPYAGKVSAVHTHESEFVQPGVPLIDIFNDSIILAKFLVPSPSRDKVILGSRILIRVKDTNSYAIAQVVRIGASLDPASSMLKVDAEIDNAEGKFQPGMVGITKLEVVEDAPGPFSFANIWFQYIANFLNW